MKTRAKKSTVATAEDAKSTATASVPTLAPSDSRPPQVFVLPKDVSNASRIVTLPHPATGAPNRYLLCPEKGSYEFTKVTPPKTTRKSWLLSPAQLKGTLVDTEKKPSADDIEEQRHAEGYILEKPDLMLATTLDPMFLILPFLVEKADGAETQMYLTASDHLDRLEERSKHFQQMMRGEGSGKLRKLFEARIGAVCDHVEAGEERLYRFSEAKFINVLTMKAQRMVANGLPGSMEEHFVKQALNVPVLSIKREQSTVSNVEEDSNDARDDTQEPASAGTSQEATSTSLSIANDSTDAPSVASKPSYEPSELVANLLRFRTAAAFLLDAYVPAMLRLEISSFTERSCGVDFAPLDEHLSRLADLRKQAQALRSLSDNISRKRSGMDDEEALEKVEAKRRKDEAAEIKKKNTSRGVQQLSKVNTTGMKKLSSFFGKKT